MMTELRDSPRDRLGFYLEQDEVALDRAAAASYATVVLPRQREAWGAVAAVATVGRARDVHAALQSMRRAGRLKSMVRGGIPPELRPIVWPLLCGAEAKRAALNEEDYYARLLRTVEAREEAELAAREAAEGVRKPGDPPRQAWETLDCVEQIDKDLGRTFPQHKLIGTAEGQASLRRLLRAYCAGRNPRTGCTSPRAKSRSRPPRRRRRSLRSRRRRYACRSDAHSKFAHARSRCPARTADCQGMNFLAGMLLCAMADTGSVGGAADGAAGGGAGGSSAGGLSMRVEENAFWMLVVLTERLLPADYYTDGLTGVRVDAEILLDLLRERVPALHAHLEKAQVLPMLPMVVTQWLIALFVLWLPTDSLLRLWDCFLADALKSKNKTYTAAPRARQPHLPPPPPPNACTRQPADAVARSPLCRNARPRRVGLGASVCGVPASSVRRSRSSRCTRRSCSPRATCRA
jgi:hypothetical protein